MAVLYLGELIALLNMEWQLRHNNMFVEGARDQGKREVSWGIQSIPNREIYSISSSPYDDRRSDDPN